MIIHIPLKNSKNSNSGTVYNVDKELKSILVKSSTQTQVIFRTGNYWYFFYNWNLPVSGQLLRWHVSSKDNWDPKAFETSGRFCLKNADIILDIKKMSNDEQGGELTQIWFSYGGSNVAYLVETSNHNYLKLKSIDENKTLDYVVAVDISSEASVVLTNSYMVYAKNDHHGRPYIVIEKELTSEKEQVLYSEKDGAYRLSVREANFGNSVLIISKKLNSEAIYYYNLKNQQGITKIWSKKFQQPIDFDTFTIKSILHLVVLLKVNEEYKVCFLNINQPTVIQQIDGINIKYHPHEVIGKRDAISILDSSSAAVAINTIILISFKHGIVKSEVKLPQKIRHYENDFSESTFYYEQTKDFVSENLIKVQSQNGKQEILRTYNIVQFGLNNLQHNIVYANSRDGRSKIPISLFWKDKHDSNLPHEAIGIINVYGSYGKNELNFNLDPIAIAAVEKGLVFAIAHVRGGGYKGPEWYHDGQRQNKWNSIYDFLDSCKFLEDHKIIHKRSLSVVTSSAGGIVSGAALNIDQSLFSAMLFFSPFINPLDSMLNSNDLISQSETSEWGNPVKNISDRNNLASYSPFQHIVKAKPDSPTILCVAGSKDHYVSNREIIKWGDKLELAGYSISVVINDNANHGGIGASVDLLCCILKRFFRLSEAN